MENKLYILDASAVLCLLFGETGHERVAETRPNALVCSVNLSEVISTFVQRGIPAEVFDRALAELELTIIPFDAELARAAGLLRQSTRAFGLSLGDRSCLALAMLRHATAVTTDRVWAQLERSISIEVIR